MVKTAAPMTSEESPGGAVTVESPHDIIRAQIRRLAYVPVAARARVYKDLRDTVENSAYHYPIPRDVAHEDRTPIAIENSLESPSTDRQRIIEHCLFHVAHLSGRPIHFDWKRDEKDERREIVERRVYREGMSKLGEALNAIQPGAATSVLIYDLTAAYEKAARKCHGASASGDEKPGDDARDKVYHTLLQHIDHADHTVKTRINLATGEITRNR